MEKTIEELKAEIKGLENEKAIAILSDYIEAHPDAEEAYILRGMKYWGDGKRASALNDYLAAIKINPESRARMALQASEDILDYRNKDLYNP